jgi:hypothetical protein
VDRFDKLVVAPECERLGVGEGKLEFTGKTIQTHKTSNAEQNCFWLIDEVIPYDFKVIL